MKTYLDKSVYLAFGAVVLIAFMIILCKRCSAPPPLIIKFSIVPDTAFVGDTIKFYDQTEGINNRTWFFGDSEKDSPAIASHVYLRSDTFHGSLSVNGKDTSFVVFIVGKTSPDPCASYQRPNNVKITPNVALVNQLVQFEDKNDDTSRIWDFADGHKSNSDLEWHSYKTSGEKWVKIKVFGACFKADIDSFLITITKPPKTPIDTIIKRELNNGIKLKEPLPLTFSKDLCSERIVVGFKNVITNKVDSKSFKKFYKDAVDDKYYILSLKSEPDGDCILRITVTYRLP